MATNPAQVQQYLAGVDYPASKDDLIQHANDKDAPSEVIDALEEIADQDYSSPADLMKELGATAY